MSADTKGLKVENRFLYHCVKFLASFFYIGYLPVMPGTWGSATGALLAWFFNEGLVWQVTVFSLAGLFISSIAERAFDEKDPSRFVLDEVAGIMISVLWIPKKIALFVVAFILFRIFDTMKPWPISMVQKSKMPTAIMWDDLLAGLFVNILLQIISRVFA